MGGPFGRILFRCKLLNENSAVKITKYTQSCLKVEVDGRALLFDVGKLTTPDYGLKDFGDIEAVLFTHSHMDHFDPDFVAEANRAGIQVYGNANVAQLAGDNQVEVIEDGEELVIADCKIKATNIEHCLMVDGSAAGVPNTSYLVDERLLIPGDPSEIEGITAEILAAPLFGPDISFKDAFMMAKSVKAKDLIAVHYDVVGMSPNGFSRLGGESFHPEAKVHYLKNGQSIEL